MAIAAASVVLASGRAPGFAAWQAPAATLPIYGYTVVHAYPHDRDAFTQGLEYEDGVLYESTGLNGLSTLRTVGLRTGRVLHEVRLPKRYFGEGIAVARSGRASGWRHPSEPRANDTAAIGQPSRG